MQELILAFLFRFGKRNGKFFFGLLIMTNQKDIIVSLFLSLQEDIKGTVSPDIAFYFRVYEFKTVLSVRPLMVFEFVCFVVLEIFKHTFLNYFYENTYYGDPY